MWRLSNRRGLIWILPLGAFLVNRRPARALHYSWSVFCATTSLKMFMAFAVVGKPAQGTIRRIFSSIFYLEWMTSPDLRRRVTAGLNKKEARNALARAVFFNRLGEMRDRSHEDHMRRASGLNVLCAAITLWNTAYVDRAVEELRGRGAEITDERLGHLLPLGWEHVALTGVCRWNLGGVTHRQLRPLRF